MLKISSSRNHSRILVKVACLGHGLIFSKKAILIFIIYIIFRSAIVIPILLPKVRKILTQKLMMEVQKGKNTITFTHFLTRWIYLIQLTLQLTKMLEKF